MPKKIRRGAAPENDFQPDPTLNLEQGAHLRIAGAKFFAPKFNEENGDLWGAMVSARLHVVDDRTEDGDADGLEFFDRFDLKFDPEVAKKFGIGPGEGDTDKDGKKLSLSDFLKNANKSMFTKEQQAALLDEENWVAMEGSKIAKLLGCLYGSEWELDVDDLEGKEFIANVLPRTGKKPGSYCGWESFVSLNPPKKKKKKSKVQQAQKEAAKAREELTDAEIDAEANLALRDEESAV
jgi:hypothetical protein